MINIYDDNGSEALNDALIALNRTLDKIMEKQSEKQTYGAFNGSQSDDAGWDGE